jgi:hypothetical protein
VRHGLIVEPAVGDLHRVAVLACGNRFQSFRQVNGQFLGEIQQRGRTVLVRQPGLSPRASRPTLPESPFSDNPNVNATLEHADGTAVETYWWHDGTACSAVQLLVGITDWVHAVRMYPGDPA